MVNLGLECLVEGTVDFHLPGNCSREFGLGFSPFRPGQMAARLLHPELLDVVAKRNQLALDSLFLRRRSCSPPPPRRHGSRLGILLSSTNRLPDEGDNDGFDGV